MNGLAYGLTPKMKPVSPKRSTVVAALDVGTSKIACMIARLKPRQPQACTAAPQRMTIEVFGVGHTGAAA